MPVGRRKPKTSGITQKATAASALAPFNQQQQKNKAEQECRELGGSDRIAQRKPRVEYAGRKCLHAKIRNGPEIRERLHQRKRGARNDARAGERERNPPECAPGAVAAYASHFEHAVGLFEKRRAREQVNVRIEHKR
jgi:hypothetical protein